MPKVGHNANRHEIIGGTDVLHLHTTCLGIYNEMPIGLSVAL